MYILYFAIIVLSILFGLHFSNKYIANYKMYSQLSDFIDYYKLQIGFTQKKLSEIISNYLDNIKNDYIYLSEFKNYIESGLYTNKSLSLENKFIEEIYTSLGRFDIIQEMSNVDNIKIKVAEKYNKSKADKEKYASFCIKIGFLIGVLIVILIL